ncbi:hypothetical protein V6Z05_19650 [Leptospira venezuelensis]|uniref:hypothetical protein n=1 Tax=Leptospira venezuelensis TaxID=1958811 RepID=UPI000A3B4571|nr:hypothetical protein [Leptospira venezuelensis]
MIDLKKFISVFYFLIRAFIAVLFLTYAIHSWQWKDNFGITFPSIVLVCKLIFGSISYLLLSIFGIIYNTQLFGYSKVIFKTLSVAAFSLCVVCFFAEFPDIPILHFLLLGVLVFESILAIKSLAFPTKRKSSAQFNTPTYNNFFLIFLIIPIISSGIFSRQILLFIQEIGVKEQLSINELRVQFIDNNGKLIQLKSKIDICKLPKFPVSVSHFAKLKIDWNCNYKIEEIEISRCKDDFANYYIKGNIGLSEKEFLFEIPSGESKLKIDFPQIISNNVIIQYESANRDKIPFLNIKIAKRKHRWRTSDSDMITCLD